VSPAGVRVVYAVLNPNFDAVHCGRTPRKFLALLTSDDQFMWKAGFEEACEDSTQFEWIDEYRIGAMMCGHANCIDWVLDANTATRLHKYFGGFDFLWSHDRRYVARRGLGGVQLESNDGMIESDELSYLLLNVNHVDVCPPINPQTRRRYDRVLG